MQYKMQQVATATLNLINISILFETMTIKKYPQLHNLFAWIYNVYIDQQTWKPALFFAKPNQQSKSLLSNTSTIIFSKIVISKKLSFEW